MKKQALRTFTMFSLVLMLTAVSVCAQSDRSGFLNIKFNFIVGGKILPAGEYTVEPNRRDSDNIWLVQSRDRHISVLFTTVSVQGNEAQERTRFVFNRYGDQYFLSQIWPFEGNSGRELLMTHREQELAKNTIERQTIVIAKGLRK
jgi:hypothetical protein